MRFVGRESIIESGLKIDSAERNPLRKPEGNQTEQTSSEKEPKRKPGEANLLSFIEHGLQQVVLVRSNISTNLVMTFSLDHKFYAKTTPAAGLLRQVSDLHHLTASRVVIIVVADICHLHSRR